LRHQTVDQCQKNGELVVPEADLHDRSKADTFTKAFAIVQSTVSLLYPLVGMVFNYLSTCQWLIMQSIARIALGLPITELELATMGYIFCAVIMYILWWNKPFCVEQPVIVRTRSLDLPSWNGLRSRKSLINEDGINGLIMINRDRYLGSTTPVSAAQMLFYATATVFSGIHLAAWNWRFPNPETALAWRVFAVVATGACPSTLLLTWYFNKVNFKTSDDRDTSGQASILLLFLFAYVVTRIGLLVLVFYSFTGMPADIYKTVE